MNSRLKPRSKDLRKGRYSQAGQIYLVTSVTHDRQPVFRDVLLGRVVVHAMRHFVDEHKAEHLAYVVMPDHFHWLFALGEQMDLSDLMRVLKGFSSKQVQRVRRQRGEAVPKGQPLWQEGFHDHALRRDEDVRDVARYVVANPLRAGLVERLGDYPLWDAVWL